MDLRGPKTKETILAIILFISFSVLYIYTAAPSVYVGDSGELAAGIKNLEIVHPTGFPLYLVTANIFAKVFPIKEFAFRLNVYSALLTALALIFIFLALRNLDINSQAAFFATSILGLGKTIWFHSGTIEVYSLSLLFTAIFLFVFSKWIKTKNSKFILWYIFLFGASLGTHVLMVTMFIPLIYMLWLTIPRMSNKKKEIIKMIFLFCVPFIQYIYLLIARSRQKTITTFKIDDISELFNYLRQKDYMYKIGARTWESTGAFLEKTASLFASEFTIAFIILAILGLIYLYKKQRTFAVITLGIISINIGIMLLYGNNNDLTILFRYFYISYALLALSIAYTLNFIFNKFKNGETRVLIFIILVGAMLVEFQSSYIQNNRRDNFVASDLANNIMLTAEPNSIILSVGDSITGPLWYLQSINIRPDVKIIDLNLLNDNSYIENWAKRNPEIMSGDLVNLKGSDRLKLRLLALLNKNIDQHKIYIISNPSDKDVTKDFEFLPVGVINQIFRKGTISINRLKELNSTNWQKYIIRGVQSNFYKDSSIDQLTQIYSIMLSNLGVVYYNARLIGDAKQAFEKSININSQNIVAQNGLRVLNQR